MPTDGPRDCFALFACKDGTSRHAASRVRALVRAAVVSRGYQELEQRERGDRHILVEPLGSAFVRVRERLAPRDREAQFVSLASTITSHFTGVVADPRFGGVEQIGRDGLVLRDDRGWIDPESNAELRALLDAARGATPAGGNTANDAFTESEWEHVQSFRYLGDAERAAYNDYLQPNIAPAHRRERGLERVLRDAFGAIKAPHHSLHYRGYSIDAGDGRVNLWIAVQLELVAYDDSPKNDKVLNILRQDVVMLNLPTFDAEGYLVEHGSTRRRTVTETIRDVGITVGNLTQDIEAALARLEPRACPTPADLLEPLLGR